MRTKKPTLIDPKATVKAVELRATGIPAQRDTDQRIATLERRTVIPNSPPVITGSWQDGTAGQSLVTCLAALGLVVDRTTR